MEKKKADKMENRRLSLLLRRRMVFRIGLEKHILPSRKLDFGAARLIG